jgi:hypothetical protein
MSVDVSTAGAGARGTERTTGVTKAGSDQALAISAVVPNYNGGEDLRACLTALLPLVPDRLCEVIVVDDCSTDASADTARAMGARVLRTPRRGGPGAARNLGVGEARGAVVLFVDADVVLDPGGLGVLEEEFADAAMAAVFGSYDDRPAKPNFFSQYKNLLHHFMHQIGRREASTFWAGCGAVRKTAYLAVGGFDADRYPEPSIEDIDLGYRLRQAGWRIRLRPSLQGKHLKRWTLYGMVKTDILRRALPWSRLLVSSRQPADLNLGSAERLRAVLAAVVVGIAALAVVGLLPWWSVPPAGIAAIAANWRLFRLFQRRKGIVFATAALAFHQIYYLYSTATYACCWLAERLRNRA